MTDQVANLLPILDTLSVEERREILAYLVEHDPAEQHDMLDDEEFARELEIRGQAIADGTALLIPADEFLDELRRKYP